MDVAGKVCPRGIVVVLSDTGVAWAAFLVAFLAFFLAFFYCDGVSKLRV